MLGAATAGLDSFFLAPWRRVHAFQCWMRCDKTRAEKSHEARCYTETAYYENGRIFRFLCAYMCIARGPGSRGPDASGT